MAAQVTNKPLLRALLAAADAGDVESALKFYAPDYIDHDATEARQGAGGPPLKALAEAFRMFSAAFTDTRHTLHDMIEEGDRLAARISVETRHTGSLWGHPPSGRILRNDSIVIYRFAEGRISERWCRERRSTRSLLESDESLPGPSD